MMAFPRVSAVSTRSSKAGSVFSLARKFPCSVTSRGNWRSSQCKKSYWRPSKMCKGQRRNNSSGCGKFWEIYLRDLQELRDLQDRRQRHL